MTSWNVPRPWTMDNRPQNTVYQASCNTNLLSILQRISYSEQYLVNCSSFIKPFFFEINKQLTTSIANLKEYLKNLLNSRLDCPVEPSEMFKTTESAARRIWLDKLNNSNFGNEIARLFISIDRSRDLCHTSKFSNLKAIHKNSFSCRQTNNHPGYFTSQFAMVHRQSTMVYPFSFP